MFVNNTSDEWIAHHAVRRPRHVAVQDEREALTYAALHELIGSGAAWLASRGVAAGSSVGLLGAPSLPWVVAYLSVARAGAVPVGLNYRETAQCIAQQVQTAAATHVLCDGARESLLGGLGIQAMELDDFMETAHGHRGQPFVTRPADGSDIGVILFTGGTTGASKGVELTHDNLWFNCINQIMAGDLDADDNVLLATALHHSAALNTWLLPHLYLGATATVMGDFDPRRWLDLMQRLRVTNTFTPPTMVRQILDSGRPGDDWSGFRKWYSGAGILSRSDRQEMVERCPPLRIYYEYGLTEAGPIVSCLRPEQYEGSPLSMGPVVRHCEVKLMGEGGGLAKTGDVGEIVVRGPAVMRGYFRQPDATAKVIRGGWLHTGDLATQDELGCLVFQDRTKDMIKSGGLNVFSQEVEAVLITHPAVAEVAVVGVPDSKWGEKVVAVVSLKSGMRASEADILDFGRGRLASYQLPKAVIFRSVSQLPKNYLGKTLKRDLREMLKGDAEGACT